MRDNDSPLPIYEHLLELRKRLLTCLACIFLFSLISYLFSEQLIRLLTKPFKGTLIFISPTEAFLLTIKISIFSGIILCTPIVFYNLWKFISVTLNMNMKKQVLYYLSASTLLSILAILFAYCLVIPAGLNFLLGLGKDLIKPFITVTNYFSFIAVLLLAFVLVFQLPLIMIFLVRNNLVSLDKFANKRRYVILFVFIGAALITPPDAFTQLCLAIPLIILYEGSILFLRIF